MSHIVKSRRNLQAILIMALLTLVLTQCSSKSESATEDTIEQLQQDFIDLRFGMFICYNIMSYGAKWGEADYDIQKFDPQELDADQWAEAATSAGMKFGLLTTKHHEGFCLWDSEFTEYDVASTPYNKDIVRQYVDSFRKKDLKIGLYYSIWDSTHKVDKDNIGPKEMEFIKGQIRELLTNYGQIDYFVIDGWFWRMGHRQVAYEEIRNLIRELQPNCLLTDHTHLQAQYHVDIPYFEGPFGAFPREDNTMPAALGHKFVNGNGWFWGEETPMTEPEPSDSIVKLLTTLESRYTTLILNCMPNRDGLLDTVFLNTLDEIGNKWKPNPNRPILPEQEKQLQYPIQIKSATASSGEAFHLIDAAQYGPDYKHWMSDKNSTQTLIFDLGAAYDGLDIFTIVPNHRCKPAPETSLRGGNILKSTLYVSSDYKDFQEVSSDSWEADGKMRTILFEKTKARYLKLVIEKFEGDRAIIAEVAAGSTIRISGTRP